jgi:hypothetical protein
MHKHEIDKNYLAQVDKSFNSERIVADSNQKGQDIHETNLFSHCKNLTLALQTSKEIQNQR